MSMFDRSDRIAAELTMERHRQRKQIKDGGEGVTLARDDSYTNGELAKAAAVYAAPIDHVFELKRVTGSIVTMLFQDIWPWTLHWLKRTNRRRDLVKAGALIIAEIERIDRAIERANPLSDPDVQRKLARGGECVASVRDETNSYHDNSIFRR